MRCSTLYRISASSADTGAGVGNRPTGFASYAIPDHRAVTVQRGGTTPVYPVARLGMIGLILPEISTDQDFKDMAPSKVN